MREAAPRVHALRDALREVQFGGPHNGPASDELRRYDRLLVIACSSGIELGERAEGHLVNLLWQVAMNEEA